MNEVLVGEIVKPHGVNGELKVYPITHDPKRFRRLKEVILQKGELKRRFEIIAARIQPDFVYLMLDQITTMDQAEAFRGWQVWIDRAEVVPLKEGWYYFELEGLQVYEGETYLGTLIKVIETGANDVYLVKGPLGEICIPALKSVVQEVDIPGNQMKVILPAGLLEDENE